MASEIPWTQYDIPHPLTLKYPSLVTQFIHGVYLAHALGALACTMCIPTYTDGNPMIMVLGDIY
jgi:hypothetical protein